MFILCEQLSARCCFIRWNSVENNVFHVLKIFFFVPSFYPTIVVEETTLLADNTCNLIIPDNNNDSTEQLP